MNKDIAGIAYDHQRISVSNGKDIVISYILKYIYITSIYYHYIKLCTYTSISIL